MINENWIENAGADAQGAQELQAQNAFAEAEKSIRKNSKTFFFATSLLPERERRAVRALYAFCRSSDDLVDVHGATPVEMERWRSESRLPLRYQRNPILYVWAQTRAEFGVDTIYEDELIAGVSSDLECRRYVTWEQLQMYCYQVASTVGLMSMPIVGLHAGVTFEQAAPYAIQMGIALQLTNILRDVGEDAARGRVYLPDEDLARFGLTREELLMGVQDERFISLMKFEIERARQLYRQAIPGIALLSASGRVAVGAAALLYRAILDEIETIRYRVYQLRARTSGLKKLIMLPRIVVTILNLHPPL
jgi:15-cis-phytoene synthase